MRPESDLPVFRGTPRDMQGLVLILKSAPPVKSLGDLLPTRWRDYVVGAVPEGRGLWLQGHQLEWFIHVDEMTDRSSVEEDYRQNDDLDEEFRAALGGQSFALLSFNDFVVTRDFVRALLGVLPGHLSQHWVDNDYGVVIRADRFMADLEANADWDWRTQKLSSTWSP